MKRIRSAFKDGVLALFVAVSIGSSALASWNVYDETDSMTDVRKAFVILNSSNEIRKRFNSEKISLVARCYSDGSVDVVVNWDQFLNSHNSSPLQVRVAAEKVQALSTTASTDGDAQFIKNTGAMIKILMREQKIKLRTQDYRGTSTDVAEFNTTGFQESWAQACSWHYKYDKVAGYIYKKKNGRAKTASSKRSGTKSNGSVKSEAHPELAKLYIESIRNKIKRKWHRPNGLTDRVLCDVQIIQLPRGEVVDVTVNTCTPKNGDLSKSIESAIWAANPLPTPVYPSLHERKLNLKIVID